MKLLIVSEQQNGLPHMWVGYLLAQAVGLDVQFVLQNGSPAGQFLREKGLTVTELPFHGRADWLSLRKLRSIIRRYQPDIIHAYTAKTCWLVILAQWFHKRTRIVFYRGATRYPTRWSPSDWLLFYSDWVDAYDSNCESVAEYLRKGCVAPEKIFVNFYGHRLEWYEGGEVPATLAQKSATFRIGSVRNYRKSKGLETLVDAADLLESRGVDFELVIVGQDDAGQLARYVSQARSRKRIKLAGLVPHPWGVMRTLDCAVIPSITEGLAKAALEALACDVPVVASDVEGLSEIIESDVSGLLVPPSDPGALADAILRVLHDPKLTERLRREGQQTLRDKFSLERTRDRLLALYRRLAAEPL